MNSTSEFEFKKSSVLSAGASLRSEPSLLALNLHYYYFKLDENNRLNKLKLGARELSKQS